MLSVMVGECIAKAPRKGIGPEADQNVSRFHLNVCSYRVFVNTPLVIFRHFSLKS